MRVTAFHAQTERKRQDRSARCAEKHHRRARTRWLQRRICPVPRACAPADTARGQKLLASEQTQAILTSDGGPLSRHRPRPAQDRHAEPRLQRAPAGDAGADGKRMSQSPPGVLTMGQQADEAEARARRKRAEIAEINQTALRRYRKTSLFEVPLLALIASSLN